MSARALSLGLWVVILSACASQPDRFYALSVLPDTSRDARVIPHINVLLNVTVPSLVDRSEMVLNTSSNGIQVLDHERWAAPFADQVAQRLARDIERRRGDVLVADLRFAQEVSPPVSLQVDVAQITVQRSGHASLEAHWRIVSRTAAFDQMGGGTFEARVAGSDYATVARALSEALADMAGRIAEALPR